ncbi:MAG TPA: ABC transporter ATP-binding protein [Armatimonadota bacterium]|nr:ABC transporter ATP-binding protein [Armatimonadota bacterium]HOS42750.1 ABC transporter ATP-binding protein [Armatimonadota bacterium]
MIEARRITKFFSVVNAHQIAAGVTAVLSASLTIEDGQFISLVGASGCGKSTFLEILAGLQAPTDGEVYIDGKLVLEPLPSTRREMDAYREKYRFLSPIANGLIRDNPKHDIAMIFQDYAVFPWMTVQQNVLFTLELRGVPRAERAPLAQRYLQQVGLLGSEDKYPSQLSGGMRQRLALARALSVEPKIILMDEPFAAVDAITREKLQDDLLRLWQDTGRTIVMVTHDLDEALYLSDAIVVFSPLPGTIRNRLPVEVPRPRRRDSAELAELRARIQAIYHYDMHGESEYVG